MEGMLGDEFPVRKIKEDGDSMMVALEADGTDDGSNLWYFHRSVVKLVKKGPGKRINATYKNKNAEMT